MKRFGIYCFVIILNILCFGIAWGNESWQSFVAQLRTDAINNGIQPTVFDKVFDSITGPNPTVIKLYNTQPERRLTFLEYRQTRANNDRINLGRQEYSKNKALLTSIGKSYGVDPAFILALWGLETDYGHFMGKFSVPQSLATLAYISNRPAFFRRELLLALHIIQDGQVSLENFKGEWAGASGHPQFLPSSWYKYAVDYQQVGKKDIWNNLPNALASIANYLAKNGWQSGQPWAVEVNLPSDFNQALLGKTTVKSVNEWRNLGVRLDGQQVSGELSASIIQLNGGPAMMVFHNFRVLQTWNDSNYYVSTVGYLADKISQ